MPHTPTNFQTARDHCRRHSVSLGVVPVTLLATLVTSGLAGCERPIVPGEAWEARARVAVDVLVTTDAGVPVADAWIVLSPSGRDARTRSDGTAEFSSLQLGDYTAHLVAPGFTSADVDLTVDGSTAFTWTLAAAPVSSAAIAGVVLNPAGDALEGVDIFVDGVVSAVTDVDGSYQIVDVLPGRYALSFEPPASSGFRSWTSPGVDVVDSTTTRVSTSLPGQSPATATFVGSAACAGCHTERAAQHGASAHGRPILAPADVSAALPALQADLNANVVVPLDPMVPGATATVTGAGPTWQVLLTDTAGATSGPFTIDKLYGGFETGVAFAATVGGERQVLPLAWALPGDGVLDDQPMWVPAYTAGWFDTAGLLLATPGPAASWALQCAGCHTTGSQVGETGGSYTVGKSPRAAILEDAVGCEACHGPGSAHLTANTSADAVYRILSPKRLPALEQVEVCARCHEAVTPALHPFTQPTAWPVAADGSPLDAGELVADFADAAPHRWPGLDLARSQADQVGDFRHSAHFRGADGYTGACWDCHDAHGTSLASSLRANPNDNSLCTSCHASRFPTEADQAAHAGHQRFAPDQWGAGRCTGCHFARTGTLLRTDSLTGAGDVHGHGIYTWRPDASVATFDAAGLTRLPLGQAPISGCVDCHLQVDAIKAQTGGVCACPKGDPTLRGTHEGFAIAFDYLFGGSR